MRRQRRRRGVAAPRSRRLQADQRHARPSGRRRDARPYRRNHPQGAASRAIRRAQRRRRIRRGLPADAGMAGFDELARGSSTPSASRCPTKATSAAWGSASASPAPPAPPSTANACWSTPTSPSIAPRAWGATASSSTPPSCRPRCCAPGDRPTASSAGLERGEFIPYFQPQVDARTFEIAGLEALARWRHPGAASSCPPSSSLSRRRSSVIGAIDRAILEQARRAFQPLARTRPRRAAAVGQRLAAPAARRGAHRGPEGARTSRRATLSFELLESIYLDERDDRFFENLERSRRSASTSRSTISAAATHRSSA